MSTARVGISDTGGAHVEEPSQLRILPGGHFLPTDPDPSGLAIDSRMAVSAMTFFIR